MKKLYFKGQLIELNVSSIDEGILDGIRDGEYDSYDVRDEMPNIYMKYNVSLDNGVFLDEDDNIVDINYITMYASNIGEPLLKFDSSYLDVGGLIEAIASSYSEDEFDKIYDELDDSEQFQNDKCLDSNIIEMFNSEFAMHEDDASEYFEVLASVKSTEKGFTEIVIPEEFDTSLPMTIATHEIEITGEQMGVLIMQYNKGKLLVSPIEVELESSETISTEIYYMSDIEDNGEGRLCSDDFEEIY
jgi:hypothetical protein